MKVKAVMMTTFFVFGALTPGIVHASEVGSINVSSTTAENNTGSIVDSDENNLENEEESVEESRTSKSATDTKVLIERGSDEVSNKITVTTNSPTDTGDTQSSKSTETTDSIVNSADSSETTTEAINKTELTDTPTDATNYTKSAINITTSNITNTTVKTTNRTIETVNSTLRQTENITKNLNPHANIINSENSTSAEQNTDSTETQSMPVTRKRFGTSTGSTTPTWRKSERSSGRDSGVFNKKIAAISLGAFFVGGIKLWLLTTSDVFLGTVTHPGTLLSVRPVFNSTNWWVRFRRIFTGFGYSRYDDSDPLTHDERAALYERIRESPGINLSSIAQMEGVPLSTARHHLRILTGKGLIEDQKIRGKRRYFPRGEDNIECIAALEDEATSRVLKRLVQSGPSDVSTLADDLNRDPSTVTHHLKHLEDIGLVERNREGRSIINHPTAAAYRMLQSNSNYDSSDNSETDSR